MQVSRGLPAVPDSVMPWIGWWKPNCLSSSTRLCYIFYHIMIQTV